MFLPAAVADAAGDAFLHSEHEANNVLWNFIVVCATVVSVSVCVCVYKYMRYNTV